MNKKDLNFRDLAQELEKNNARINEIADLCEQEDRERTEAEEPEFRNLTRRNQVLQARMIAYQHEPSAEPVDSDEVLRENLLGLNRKVSIVLSREITPQTTTALADTGIIPISEQEMLNPIRTGLIWDKVGMTVRSGLVGTLRWPKHGKATAYWADEAEKLVDSKIDFSKLTMGGTRLGIAIPVTREELENSQGVVENVIMTEAPAAIIDKINDAMFATDSADRKVYGPLVAAAASSTAVTFAGSTPTRKELLSMRATVAKQIGNISGGCWVMTEDMKASLEDVKVDEGSGRFLCENGQILGYPVYTTDAIAAGYIAFGDWSYQAAGWFGQTSFIADPYTLARQNSVDFVLNMHFGTATLREEAFILGKVATTETTTE